MLRSSVPSRLLLLFLLLRSSKASSGEGDSLESLYESSDAGLKWPPQGEKKSEWPGQGERFGKYWPREKVEVLSSPPESFKDFERDFILKSRPVVIDGLLHEMTKKTSFILGKEGAATSGRAALSHVLVQVVDRADVRTLTFRDFYRSRQKDQLALRDKVHANFKTEFRVPEMLKCSDIKENFIDTKHVLFDWPKVHPLRKEHNHQLYCQFEGEKEFLLIDQEKDFPSWTQTGLREDKVYGDIAVLLNTREIDYEANPELKDLKKIHIAKLSPGQCLYVPAKWIHQQNVMNTDHSMEIRWEFREDVTKEEDLKCEGRISSVMSLADVEWKGEGMREKPKEKTANRDRMNIDLMSGIIDRYLFQERTEEMTLPTFVAAIKGDLDMVPMYLTNWTEECDTSAGQMFELLDRNGDGRLDATDADKLDKREAVRWVGRTQDRHTDLAEIGFDQQLDRMVDGGAGQNVMFNIVEMVYQHEESEKEAWRAGDYLKEMETKQERRKAKADRSAKDEL